MASRREPRAYTISQESVSRMVALCRDASPQQWTAAHLWYPLHGAAVIREGAKAGFDAQTSCALFACLSPQTRIQINWRNYRQVLADGHANDIRYATKVMRRKINGLLRGSFTISDVVAGDKVHAFFANLLGDLSQVCVDTHAANCVDGAPRKRRGLKGFCYQEYAEYFRVVATVLGIEPAVAQPLLWIVWRDLMGIKDDAGMSCIA